MKKVALRILTLCLFICSALCVFGLIACTNDFSDLLFEQFPDGTYYVRECLSKGKKEITVPSTYKGEAVTGIGEYAFSGCSSLTSITIPDSVMSIGRDAFYGCYNLQYNEYDNAYYLGNDNNPYLVLVEAKLTDITSCTINENTKIVYNSAFFQCSSLTRINYNGSIDGWCEINFYNNYYSNPLYYAHNLYINDELVTEVNVTTATKINDFGTVLQSQM